MIHVTCDLCGKEIRPGDDQRYVVKIEVFAAHDPYAITEGDLEDDHLQEVSQVLAQVEDSGIEFADDDPASKHLRYDLCPACRKRFLKDPLNREGSANFNFSEN